MQMQYGLTAEAQRIQRKYGDQAREKALGTPSGILEDDAVAIGIFKGFALLIPIGIEGWDGLETILHHAINGGLSFGGIRQVEHNQVVLCRGASGSVTVFDGKFEMIRRVGMTKHEAVKAFVIFKGANDFQAGAVAIKAQDVGHMVGGTGDTQVRLHEQSIVLSL